MTLPPIVSFGPFEFDRRSGELRKHGMRVRLADQPRTVLELLLDRHGDIVTREEIRQRLWAADTFVDFDAGLSSVVRKLRDALGESADQPRYIETVPRRGYRFIAAATTLPAAAPATAAEAAAPVRRRAAWMAAAIAVSIGALLFAEIGITSRPRISPEANDAFLKGVAAAGRESVAGFHTAVAYFEQATREQPTFALAYARLADAQVQLLYAGRFAPRDIVPRADVAVRKALALDDSIALAHRTRAAILLNYYWQWEAGDRELQRARQLDGASIAAHTHQAAAALSEGRYDEAIADAQRARARDPLAPAAALNLGTILRTARQFDPALSEFRAALALNPQMARGYFQLGITYAFMERWPDAIDAFGRALQITPDNSRFLAYQGFAFAKAGRADDARNILERLRVLSRTQYVSSFGIALILDALGERDAARAAIGRAFDDHALELAQWRQYPPFPALQADPRFQALSRRAGRIP